MCNHFLYINWAFVIIHNMLSSTWKQRKHKAMRFFIKQANNHATKKKEGEARWVVRKYRCRNWTPEKTEFFANVLTDKGNRFAASVERLALKKQLTTKYLIILKKNLIESEVKTKKETFAIRTEICKVTRLLIHQLIHKKEIHKLESRVATGQNVKVD